MFGLKVFFFFFEKKREYFLKSNLCSLLA